MGESQNKKESIMVRQLKFLSFPFSLLSNSLGKKRDVIYFQTSEIHSVESSREKIEKEKRDICL